VRHRFVIRAWGLECRGCGLFLDLGRPATAAEVAHADERTARGCAKAASAPRGGEER
jgi:hypothetical protein